METNQVLQSLSALAQGARLAVFRHLVQLGPSGACPGDIAAHLGLGGSTLSFHLKTLAHAGLIRAEHSGRSITYRADFGAMRGLVEYLTENCCGGDASRCAPPQGLFDGDDCSARISPPPRAAGRQPAIRSTATASRAGSSARRTGRTA